MVFLSSKKNFAPYFFISIFVSIAPHLNTPAYCIEENPMWRRNACATRHMPMPLKLSDIIISRTQNCRLWNMTDTLVKLKAFLFLH